MLNPAWSAIFFSSNSPSDDTRRLAFDRNRSDLRNSVCFFAGSETALTAASRASMHRLEKEGSEQAAVVNRLSKSRPRMLSALLVGNNVVNIVASSLATSVLLYWLGDWGVLYATAVMSVMIIVFGEVLPKNAALMAPDRVALAVARPVDHHIRDGEVAQVEQPA